MGFPGSQRPLSIMGRDWTGNQKLDLIAKPEAFLIWKDRAMSHLSKDRIDIKRLLMWAEVQPDVLQQSDAVRGASETGVTENMQTVNHTLFEAIKAILDDALMTRARQCDSNGLELWRKFHTEWKGFGTEVISANAMRYQYPRGCTKISDLWERLPE